MPIAERELQNNTKKEVNSIKKEAENLYTDLTQGVRVIADTASQVANDATRKVGKALKTCKESGQSAMEYVEYEARENPIRTLAITLGIGFVLGKIFLKK